MFIGALKQADNYTSYLELSQRAIIVEHRIALLDGLAFFLAGRQDHGLERVMV